MNPIENYLIYRARSLPKHISAGFIIHMIVTMVSFGIVCSFFMIFPPDARFILTHSVALSNPSASIVTFAEALSGITVSLLVLFAASFTFFSRKIMYFLCIWRGGSLGCAAALTASGAISGLPATASCALMAAFLQTVVFILLVSFTDIYSDCLLQIFSHNDRLYKNAVVREFLLCYLTMSGVILFAGIIEVLLLIT